MLKYFSFYNIVVFPNYENTKLNIFDTCDVLRMTNNRTIENGQIRYKKK